MKITTILCLVSILFVCILNGMSAAPAPVELVQVRQDFSSDPGWDNWNNRVVFESSPTVVQDFGWRPTSHSGGLPGEIGGTIWRSTTPAWYAMPFGKPLSFKDSFSASGKIVVMPPQSSGVYFGFFGAERPGWRCWSSLAFRLMRSKQGDCMVDYKTGLGKSNLCDPGACIPPDGKPHTWTLSYEPESVPNLTWPDLKMATWLTDSMQMETNVLESLKQEYPDITTDRLEQLQGETNVLDMAKKDYPDMTVERLRGLLSEAFNRGIIDKHMLKGKYPRWAIVGVTGSKGRITFSVDGQVYSSYMLPGHQNEPTTINRFGIYNEQMFSDSTEVYLSDLVINGHKVDLSKDPHWEGRGNQMTYIEPEPRERMNFGYSETNWAGESPGEVGGKLWSTEPGDPHHGYYADEVGQLTLEDKISFAGSVCFVDGGPDGLSFIGYFNRDEKIAPIEGGDRSGHPLNQSMGIVVHDFTKIGYYFQSVCSPTNAMAQSGGGPIFVPDRVRRKFTFDYDPKAGKAGRITVTLDNDKFTQHLTPEMRYQGASLDRFGIMNARIGGKYQVIYYDDIIYTARRPAGYESVKHEQKTVTK